MVPDAIWTEGRGPMKINADISKRAVVDSDSLNWLPSPLPGVARRMLEREGGEVARVTSLVRYAPASRFSAHTHSGGEEFLVLAGTFSDNHGDYPVGTYVRNPVGSSHVPRSDEGCLILVKLWWMHADDQAFVRIDTTDEALWRPANIPGIDEMDLHDFGEESNVFYRLAARAVLPARELPGGEELFVLEGSCRDANGDYAKGTWLRTPIGAAPALQSESGCRLYVKRGHLKAPPPGPPPT